MLMNVILFTSAANSSGGSRQALYLAGGLAEHGHTVRFFVPRQSSLPALAPGAPFWRFFGARSGWKEDIETAMNDMARNGNPVVIHAFHNAAVKRAAWWGLFWKKRALVVAHRGVLFRPNNPLPYWSPGVDAFLVNSRACATILRGIGLSSERLFYVPNCVPDKRLAAAPPPAALRAAFGIGPDAPVFLCIGGNKSYKGVKELLLAFASAFPSASVSSIPNSTASPGPNVTPAPHLIVLGLDPALWRPLSRRLGLEERAHLLEKREDIGGYLAAASVFVLPSLSESMPNTLLEAVRAGLPCIGTDVGAVSDILCGPEKACGLVVPPGNVPALAAAMRRLAADPELRAAFSAAALAKGGDYRPEKRIALVERIYTELLQKKGLL